MTALEKEPTGLVRREAAVNAHNAIAYQYATSTKKETKTPSTKKFPDPVSLRFKAAPSNKRDPILLSSDEDDQPPRKRASRNLSSTNSPAQHPNPQSGPVTHANFQVICGLISRLQCESNMNRAANEELKEEIAMLKQAVSELSDVLECYERVMDKTQIMALEAQLLSERNQARVTRIEQVRDQDECCARCIIPSCEGDGVNY